MTRFAIGLTLLSAALVPTSALAGKCDTLVAQAGTAQGAELVAAYGKLLACDQTEAKAAYVDFMKNSGDAETLVDLSVLAIDKKVYAEVWNSLDKIKEYSARDKVAKGVGEACGDHPEVVTFLKGAYFGLRDIQLGKWADAYVACDNDEVVGFIKSKVVEPPARSFDEKYNIVLKIWTEKKRKDALADFSTAAVAAAGNGGPFSSILDSMDQAVQPTELGADITEEDRKALEQALVGIAGQVQPEFSKQVADKLFNAGAEEAAASLLPKIYPDRVQAGGGLLYGVAAVESCDKEAVIHYATVTEPAKRWSVVSDLEGPARQFKARLKCTASDPWPVLATPEPVMDDKAVEAWAAELEAEWASKVPDVKLRAEKGLSLD